MKKAALTCIVLCSLCVAAPKYTPTSDYTVKKIEGWKVLVNNELLTGHPKLARDTLKLLRYQLYQITRVVPPKAIEKLRSVPIWVEYKAPKHPCMCYHPDKGWLISNDFNPEKERSVELANAQNFLKMDSRPALDGPARAGPRLSPLRPRPRPRRTQPGL